MSAHLLMGNHAAMATQRISSDALLGRVGDLVDDTLTAYRDWREDADSVGEAYGRWAAGPPTEEVQRFSAFLAALDQEESAAKSFAEALQRLDRCSRYGRV